MSTTRVRSAVEAESSGRSRPPWTWRRTCPLFHMIELAASREIVYDLIGQTGLPHLLLRVGRAEPDVEFLVTPGRPVAEVLEIR